MTGEQAQQGVDTANADFWTELCGSHLAREIGVTDASAASLARFDQAYFDVYPYLGRYLPWHSGERVLEIGLGYGTVGQALAQRGLDYHGLDISPGPVAIPHPDESFAVVVSIGCLHHTGDLAGAVAEVRRVLRPGGEALVMVYNSHSYRRAVMLPVQTLRGGVWRDSRRRAEFVRAAYDSNTDGVAAPTTEFTSVAGIRRLFAGFSQVKVRRENFDDFVLRVGARSLHIPRKAFLNNLARIAGSDLYVSARK
jgi:SAM-dependent methyltransferase